jgi:hypothetical protein
VKFFFFSHKTCTQLRQILIQKKKHNLSQITLRHLIAKYKIKLSPSNYWKDKNYFGNDQKFNYTKILEFFKDHSQEEVKFFYKHFPYNPLSLIRCWSSKAR